MTARIYDLSVYKGITGSNYANGTHSIGYESTTDVKEAIAWVKKPSMLAHCKPGDIFAATYEDDLVEHTSDDHSDEPRRITRAIAASKLIAKTSNRAALVTCTAQGFHANVGSLRPASSATMALPHYKTAGNGRSADLTIGSWLDSSHADQLVELASTLGVPRPLRIMALHAAVATCFHKHRDRRSAAVGWTGMMWAEEVSAALEFVSQRVVALRQMSDADKAEERGISNGLDRCARAYEEYDSTIYLIARATMRLSRMTGSLMVPSGGVPPLLAAADRESVRDKSTFLEREATEGSSYAETCVAIRSVIKLPDLCWYLLTSPVGV